MCKLKSRPSELCGSPVLKSPETASSSSVLSPSLLSPLSPFCVEYSEEIVGGIKVRPKRPRRTEGGRHHTGRKRVAYFPLAICRDFKKRDLFQFHVLQRAKIRGKSGALPITVSLRESCLLYCITKTCKKNVSISYSITHFLSP